MRQLLSDARDTLRLNSAELRYSDPRTIQVYQGTFLLVIAVSLLMYDITFLFGLVDHPMWRVGGVFAIWRDRNIWSTTAGLLGLLVLVSRSYTYATRFLLFCAAMFWFAFTARVALLIGFLPLSTGLTALLAIHAALGYFRLRHVVNGRGE